MHDKFIKEDKLEKYNQFINNTWKKYLDRITARQNFRKINSSHDSTQPSHIFLSDMILMENDEPEYQSFLNPNVKSGNDINISNYFKEATHKSIPKKILPKKTVNDIMKSFFSRDEFPSWNKLKILLDDFSNYLLYSTVELKKYTKQLQNRDDDTINILILGAGPTGLYCYLSRLY